MPSTGHGLIFVTRVANRVIIALLESRAGTRLGRHLAVVEYVGHRSGCRHRLVTQYVREGTAFRIGVGMAGRKTWWRNFSMDRPLRLRLAGHDHDATAHAVRDGDRLCVVGELLPVAAARAWDGGPVPVPGVPR